MVMQAIGAGMSLLGNLFGHKSNSAQQMLSLKNNLKYYDYTRPKELQDQITLMKKQNALNKNFMSNSSKATQALNENLMDYQYALERQSRQTAYADTRKDLESAGYNPLLAVGQQSGYTSVGSGVSTQSEGLENTQLASSATEIMNRFNEMRNANELTKQNQSRLDLDKLSARYNNDLTSAQAEKARSETRGQDISNTIQNLVGLNKAEADLDLTRKQAANLDKAREYMTAQIKNLASTNEVSSAQSAYYRTLQEGERYKNEEYKKQAQFNKTKYGKGLYYVGQTTGAIGNIFGASASVGRR